MRRSRVTLYDLAEELKLTIQTVSKALRGLPGMSEQTRSEIIKLAKQRGYLTKDQKLAFRYEKIAPYPVTQRRFLLVQNEYSLNFNRLLLEGLHERFMEFGHQVQSLLLPPGLKLAEFGDWAEASGFDYAEGLFIAPRMGYDAVERKLLELPIPRILLNYPPPEAKVDSVIWDVHEAMHQAVRHLLRLGHTRIMYVGDASGQRGFALRWQAFAEAMAAGGASVDAQRHCTVRDIGERWLDEFVRLYDRYKPTAIICGLDEETEAVYGKLREIAVDIPNDCSLVAFMNESSDNRPACSRPQLLIRETGYRAADRMLWRIANPHMPYEHIRLRGDFVPGETTAATP
ncbi:LacI family DNA-binding transcriptional regulator [Paenibacillus allorhizosphaerae]|uniref:HTH-type transcriptional regulator DegA n=1 Tax=Paenibacillus allorhizosphaerae TaxID=2849866 RepID=A0ABN7TS48_9BACL|nr:LacI family DNA-binding transcriptional regulator [Paenibacillus allorhizosphaerae]CAG7649251.1 HTH-type transcriptional regulator DegA [Paenibacillus allorhizosphaerae]